jgi:hypothetical protein
MGLVSRARIFILLAIGLASAAALYILTRPETQSARTRARLSSKTPFFYCRIANPQEPGGPRECMVRESKCTDLPDGKTAAKCVKSPTAYCLERTVSHRNDGGTERYFVCAASEAECRSFAINTGVARSSACRESKLDDVADATF